MFQSQDKKEIELWKLRFIFYFAEVADKFGDDFCVEEKFYTDVFDQIQDSRARSALVLTFQSYFSKSQKVFSPSSENLYMCDGKRARERRDSLSKKKTGLVIGRLDDVRALVSKFVESVDTSKTVHQVTVNVENPHLVAVGGTGAPAISESTITIINETEKLLEYLRACKAECDSGDSALLSDWHSRIERAQPEKNVITKVLESVFRTILDELKKLSSQHFATKIRAIIRTILKLGGSGLVAAAV